MQPDDMSMSSRSSAALTPGAPLDPQSPIIALASPPGPGARAILRLTGASLGDILQQSGILSAPLAAVPRHSFTYILLACLSCPLPVEILSWCAPRTYTGQDLVEIHLLGSPPLVQALMEHLLAHGFRLAQPGEFTLRAFLAGKLDLTQAEAVHGLITAKDQDELRTALAQLAGGLARPLDKMRDELLHLLAELEAGLDFADEDISFISGAEITRRLATCKKELEETDAQLEQRRTADQPFRVVFLGAPNAGKSSLFNALIGRDTALVSPVAGTTRDYVSAHIKWDDVEIELIDTAGEETLPSDNLATQAQTMRREQAAQADLCLVCMDCREGVPPARRQSLQSHSSVLSIPVWTKGDLPHRLETMPETSWLLTSATTGLGIAALQARMVEQAHHHSRSSALAPSLTRCRSHLHECLEHVREAEKLAQHQAYPELLALELRLALDALGRIVGAVYTEDLLDRVFSQFCIGK
jgi:tRNA modification GTPase